MKVAKINTPAGLRWIADSQRSFKKRIIRRFDSRAEAEKCLLAWEADQAVMAEQWISLSDTDKIDAIQALRIARRGSFTLTEAATAYRRPTEKAMTIREAISTFLATRQTGYRRAYREHLGKVLNQFAIGRDQLRVDQVTPEHIRTFLAPSYAPATLQGMRRRLSTFFAWALAQEIITKDPMVKVEFPRVAQSAPKILTVDEAERLMSCAEADEPGFLRFLALALFCGVRPEEIRRLKDEDIKLDRGFVEIGADASKVGSRRLVSIPENIRGWIDRPEPLLPVGFWKRLRKLRAKAGTPWACDILRHTAASMMLARDEDAPKVALQLGNSPEILFRHYRELVTKEDAARFWGIRPR